MNCNDCCYNLPRDGHPYCTYEDGECIKISILEKENAELEKDKEYFSDALDKQIAATFKVVEQLNEAKDIIKGLLTHNLKMHNYVIYNLDKDVIKIALNHWLRRAEQFLKENEKHHYEAEVINGKLTGKAILVSDSFAYAKSIIKDLLNNSDEYAKQRAKEFLEENLK